MQSLSYWKQFESTGKVEDYLFYSGMSPGEAGISVPEAPAGQWKKALRTKSAKGVMTGDEASGAEAAAFWGNISDSSGEYTERGTVGSESL